MPQSSGITPMTYADSGVKYDVLDRFKRAAQKAAGETSDNIPVYNRNLLQEFKPSRGESAYLVEAPDFYLAHVEEGLGTKNLVADAMYALTMKSSYDYIAQDTVAMIVNDAATLGASPISVAMHLAVGDSDWFKDEVRTNDLIFGWRHSCNLSRCSWGGGETPTLKDIIRPETVVLSGSAIGIINPKEHLITDNIQHGDAIVLIESSGIHANGLTLARRIAGNLPDGYLTRLPNGLMYGNALLEPTHIYVGLIQDCLRSGLKINYAVNITGHGWRKLMRATRSFKYIIEKLPAQLPIFDFIQKHGPVSDEEAYGNLNMGAGFALYVSERNVNKVLQIARGLGLNALYAGHIENGEKEVVIEPKGIRFAGNTLTVR